MTPELLSQVMTGEELERAWTAACGTAGRAERACKGLAMEDVEADVLMAAVWLALWRAEERMRALEGARAERRRSWPNAA